MAMAVMEGIILSFVLLLVCVINIKDGPVGGVHYYEPPVQERVVELGLITKEQIKKNLALSSVTLLVPLVVCIPLLVVFINGARSFKDAFLQLLVIYMICGAFDRIFIDWYWVGHTKAWFIPGTEDLMPYIHKETLVKKIVLTIVLYPVLAAILALIISLFA